MHGAMAGTEGGAVSETPRQEYERLDRAAERAHAAVRQAYEEARRDRYAKERAVFEAALRAELAGEDPKAAARRAIDEAGLPMIADVVAPSDPKHGLTGLSRYQCDGYCNEQYRRLGKPRPEDKP